MLGWELSSDGRDGESERRGVVVGGIVFVVCEVLDADDEWIDESGVLGPDPWLEDSDELEDVSTARGLCGSESGIASVEESTSCAGARIARDMAPSLGGCTSKVPHTAHV